MKAARTRIKNLTAEANHAWENAAKVNASTLSKAQLRKLKAAVHPDAEINASAARKAQLLEASQIINGIKIQERD